MSKNGFVVITPSWLNTPRSYGFWFQHLHQIFMITSKSVKKSNITRFIVTGILVKFDMKLDYIICTTII